MTFRRFGSSVAVVLAGFAAHAGTLRVGAPEINGTRVVLPVLLEGDVSNGVAAMDFVVQYDPAVFEPVSAEAGAAAVAARKQVQSSEISPGNYVVLLFGMNQTTITGGQVANIVLNTKGQPAENQSAVTIEETTLSSVDGLEIPSSGSAQTVTFPPPPTDGGDDDAPDDGSDGDSPPPTDDDGGAPQPDPDRPEPTQPTDPATPLFPSAPAGKPDSVDNDSSRVAPIAVGAPGESAPMAGTAGRLARLNEAAQRLDSARATLSAPTVDGDDAPSQPGTNSTEDSRHSPTPEVSRTTAPVDAGEPALKVAAAAPSNVQPISSLPSASSAAEESDAVLPTSARRYLIGGALAACVAWLAFRYRPRRTG